MNLRIENLTKTYSNGRSTSAIKALNDITLEIGKGMFGLLGPNGAGKSSLMRTLATLQDPDTGSIHFGNIDTLKDPMALKEVLGYLPQDFGVYPKVSAESLLDMFAVLKGIGSKKDRSIVIDKVLELTNLSDVRKKYVSGYSGGMKQRFGIAQLLLNNPKLIIVDEPTAGLDPAERTRFLNVLRDVGIDNTVIFSTHLVDDVEERCNDLAIINKGQVLTHNTPANILSELKGKIFSKDIDKSMLTDHESRFVVLSSSYNPDNSLKIRTYDDLNHDGFKPENPNLEDAYFTALKSHENRNSIPKI
ncbi:MAG: ABC transporter ATP-binding protein [Ekhidna sp.]